MAKVRSLIEALASALCEHGVHNQLANLAAQMGMATLGHAVASWLDGSSGDLDEHIVRAFHEVRDLSLSSSELVRGMPATVKG